MATAVLIDAEVIGKERNTHLVVDKNKTRRGKEHVMKELQLRGDQQDNNESINCLFFDGRKDETKTVVHAKGSVKLFPREVK